MARNTTVVLAAAAAADVEGLGAAAVTLDRQPAARQLSCKT